MKKIITTIICIVLCEHIIAQSDNQKDSAMYMVAYKYIINDSINNSKSIAVSDSIVDLDRYWTSGLESFPKEKKILCQYRAKKKFKRFDTFHSPYLSFWFCKAKNPSSEILFFSQIEDSMLRADLLPCDSKYTSQSDKFVYSKYLFLTGCEYLFIFNIDGTIKKVLRQDVIYE